MLNFRRSNLPVCSSFFSSLLLICSYFFHICICIFYIYHIYYKYIYIYICVCAYVYIYIYICVCIHIYIYIYIFPGIFHDQQIPPGCRAHLLGRPGGGESQPDAGGGGTRGEAAACGFGAGAGGGDAAGGEASHDLVPWRDGEVPGRDGRCVGYFWMKDSRIMMYMYTYIYIYRTRNISS